jgi:hypothetical protein
LNKEIIETTYDRWYAVMDGNVALMNTVHCRFAQLLKKNFSGLPFLEEG